MLNNHAVVSLHKIVPSYMQQVPELIHGCFLCKPGSETEILARTANFSLICDISPIVDGHLMITSNTHIGCTGEIDPMLREEYLILKKIAGEIVKTAYGAAAYYEHGRAGHCSTIVNTAIKCDHFHLHVLPIKVSINPELEKSFIQMELEQYSQIFEFFERYGSYLYFEDFTGHINIYPASDSQVESHLLRTLICEKIGCPERSNWETHTNLELVNKAIENYMPIIDRLAK